MSRFTKIVATLGPASDAPEQVDALLAAGVDVFRLNLSHGALADHLELLRTVRERSAAAGRVVAVLADLPGPKVRCGEFPDGGVFLQEGATVRLVPGAGGSTEEVIEIDYPELTDDLHIGDPVILGDGGIRLEVAAIGPDSVYARVVTGGRVQGRPGAHLPTEQVRLSAPTAVDLALAEALRGEEIDFLAVSFVRAAHDLERVRGVVGPAGPCLVAKIETAAAVAALPDILQVADAVMVARGDLGIDCAMEDVPHLQKQIIRACGAAGLPVITATQMLESMITSPTPTRAEVSDVANAVFDGTDAIMLSGETAIGHDPALVVRTMARIATRAEEQASYARWAKRHARNQRESAVLPDRVTHAVSHAAWQAASDIGVAAILCCTRSGRTVRAMTRFRPLTTLIGLSPSLRTVRTLALSWGVRPMSVETYGSTDELVWHAVESAVASGEVHIGDTVVVLAGAPDGTDGSTDVMRIVRVR